MELHRPEAEQVQVYARVEEIDIEEGRVLLDCVRTDSNILIQLMDETHQQLKLRWRRSFRFADDQETPSMDVLIDVPTAMVTIQVDDAALWRQRMLEATWLQLRIVSHAFISEEPLIVEAGDLEAVPSKKANKLSAILDMTHWPRVPAHQLRDVLNGIPPVQGVIVHDVGQGSANALFDSSGKAVVYFDVGRGGKGTSAPKNLELCDCNPALVILSHWDRDHWAAATDGAQGLLKSSWVVPSQKIASSHAKFAALILHQGGLILVVKRSSKPRKDTTKGQRIHVKYCKGVDRNNSGLALTLTCRQFCDSHTMYFPGDAKYDMCEDPPKRVSLLVASHHGADPEGFSKLPEPSQSSWSRLVYSFGRDNGHKHPFDNALSAHGSRGWDHTGWNDSSWKNLAGVGNVRATYTDFNSSRQSIVFSADNRMLGAHFRAAHGETLLS